MRLRGRTQLLPSGPTLIARLGDRLTRIAPFGPVEEQVLHLLAKGTSDLDEETADWRPDDRTRANELAATLRDAGFLEAVEPPATIRAEDLARFDRLLHYFSEQEDGAVSRFDRLRRLLDARVLVVGTGGMGSWLLYGLACCGVRDFVLVDSDVVEPSNLNRSILFGEGDIGRAKVDAAAEALTRFSPRARVRAVAAPITGPGDLLDHLDGVDLVVGAADQPIWLVREWLARACRQAGVPLLHPSGLRVGPFYLPGRSACPMCEFAQRCQEQPRFAETVARLRRLPRGTSGGLAPWAGITASVATAEVFRHLAGLGNPMTVDAVWTWRNGGTSDVTPLLPQAGCPVCHGEGLRT
jgi:hypothetical protein